MTDLKGTRLGVLKIEREFKASIEEVFAAFTEPETMSQWFYGFPSGAAQAQADLRIGGKYCIEMFAAASANGADANCGASAAHYGEYLEIDPPRRLAFTWKKDGFVEYSVVSIDFAPRGSKTLVSLTHRVPTETVKAHTQGWNLCLDNLAKLFA